MEANKVIEALQDQLGSDENELLNISGVLYSSGFNFGLLLDADNWYMNATFVSPDSNQPVSIRDLFKVRFKNGGFKFDLSYKWMFIFVPSGIDVRTLNHAVYGRGLGLTLDVAFGVDVAWMPGNESPGQLFLVAPKVGFGAGLTFPKMEFEMQELD